MKLREKDAAHEQAVIAFKRKLSELNQILIANGIAVPPELLQMESPQAAIAVRVQADGVQSMRTTMPPLITTENQSWSQFDSIPSNTTASSNEMSDLVGTYGQMRFADGSQFQPQPTRAAATIESRSHTHSLDATQVAVDFVLDLERPCLAHLGLNLHDDKFNGHRLMVTAHASTPRPVYDVKMGSAIPNNTTWTVPAIEMERLLNFSSRLSLEGELTPIEAWQQIKQHPGFRALDQDRLDELKAVLLPEVQCYG